MSDSTSIYLREFDAERLQAFRNDPLYDYVIEEAAKPDSNWLQELIDKLASLFSGNVSSSVWEYAGIALVLLFVLFLIFRILKADRSWFLKKGKRKSDPELLYAHAQQMEHTDFEQLAEEAVMQNDYRLAVRFHYLGLLQKLDRENLISREISKTNRTYALELEDPGLRQWFRKACFLYEYIWYGDFPVDRLRYESAKETFMSLDQYISTGH